MPLQATSGAASYDAFGGGVPVVPAYIEDVFSTYLYTGNGSTQTITNGIALGTASGGSVFFGGNPAYLNLSAAPTQFGTGDFTVETWINPTAVTPTGSFIELSPFTGSSGWAFGVGFPSSGVMYWYTNGANLLSYSGISVGVWTHVAVSRSGSTNRMFVNGALVATATDSTNYNQSGATNIGTDVAAQFFRGNLSNLRVVKGTALYTSAFTPPTEPLTVVSGTSLLTCQTPNTVQDYSSNAYSITNNGAIPQNGGGPFTDATAGKGGLVWIKCRTPTNYNNWLSDTDRGNTKRSSSNTTSAESTLSTSITSFNSNGFSIGSNSNVNDNGANETFASWTFRKQPKFFDIVTFSGDGRSSGSATINHSLGVTPAVIIFRQVNGNSSWQYGTNFTSSDWLSLFLNNTNAGATTSYVDYDWFAAQPTSTTFTVGWPYFAAGATYVAYLFASNAGGFGLTGTDNVISCGSFTGSGAGVATTIDLGYEPQFIIAKRTDAAQNWVMFDNMRGFDNTNAARLFPNLSNAESTVPAENYFTPTATGFKYGPGNSMGDTANIIYIAIRRGPMKVPTSGTSVFSPQIATSSGSASNTVTTNFPVDLAITQVRNGYFAELLDRLRGDSQSTYVRLRSASTAAEATGAFGLGFDNNTGYVDNYNWQNFGGGPFVYWNFRRAPSFFDVVCYTGTGSTQTIAHNLGVAPELYIVKQRSSAQGWCVGSSYIANTGKLALQTDSEVFTDSTAWNSTYPTSSVLTVGSLANTNENAKNFVAYLFATCAGVSKVGSYTGTATTKQIDCGFTGGARFVLIKRTDSTGAWYVWDSARGIVSGNDPYLLLNTTAAEVTNTDYIDTYSAGFEISSTAPAAINANGGSYIFLAIA